jgi:ABC-type branched-subunit amino acid transport system ATPase component
MPNTSHLLIEGLCAGYDGADVVRDVDIRVDSGEVVCVIGPNGAGKSTLFAALYGLLPVRRGRVLLAGRDITGSPAAGMLALGVTIVPQQRSLFPQMTVDENLEMGMYLERDRGRVEDRKRFVLDLFPELADKVEREASKMSGGEQRMLEIGRALMWEPSLLLLDEPSAGLAPRVSTLVLDTVRRLNQRLGLTVLMIEQNVYQGLRISDRFYALERGRVSRSGAAAILLEDPTMQRAFLGASRWRTP